MQFYRPERFAADMRPMHALVTAIAGAWWSRGLYAHTSMWSLKIAQTNPFDIMGKQVLTVHPVPAMPERARPGEMLFVFDGWETSCAEAEAFAKLDHILRNRLKWIAGDPPA